MISIQTDENGRVTTKYNGPAPGAKGWTELPDSAWPEVEGAADYFYDKDGNGEITYELTGDETTGDQTTGDQTGAA
jgi:acetaldehyde dehydrogenase (acetylating)